MSGLPFSARRLSPAAKAGLGVFARYATILGLLAMIACFLRPLAGRVSDLQQFRQRAQPDVAGDDHRRRADARGDRRRARSLDRLRREPAWRAGHRADRADETACAGRDCRRTVARRGDWSGQRLDRDQAARQFSDCDARRRHHHRRAHLRLFRRRPDRRRRARRIPRSGARRVGCLASPTRSSSWLWFWARCGRLWSTHRLARRSRRSAAIPQRRGSPASTSTASRSSASSSPACARR